MQRQLTSFDINVIVHELQEIIDSPIDKSYQLSKNDIIIKIKNKKTNKKESLFIRNGQFLTITDQVFQTPKNPSNFVMGLRKYIQNGRILKIFQHEFDRIIKIEIGKRVGVFTLIIEFFSDGNIILVDPNGDIIIPFLQQSWAHRKIKGRQPYMPPPSQINPFTLSFSQFSDIIKTSTTDIVRTLAVKLQLSGPIAEEICVNTSIEKQKQIHQLTPKELQELFDSLQNFLHQFQTDTFQPILIEKENKTIDILPFPFSSYKQVKTSPIEKFTQGLTTFIDYQQAPSIDTALETKTDKLIGQLHRMLKQQQEKIKTLDKKIQKKKREGDLIYLHYNDLEHLLTTIQQLMKEKEKTNVLTTINSLEFVKSFDPKQNKLIVSLKDTNNTVIDVPLLFRKSVSENAEHAYDESKKSVKKKHGAEKSIQKTKEKLQKAVQHKKIQLKAKDQQSKQQNKTKHFWFERYRWTISSDGNLILAGKDAKSNDQLIKKHLEKHDRYVHADIHGAPSCIVKQKTWDDTPCDISIQTLEQACIFAACYSRAWKQFTEAQSYWVLPQQVSKTPQSGEYIPKGAFIIRGKRNYCKCELKLGIGKLIIDNDTRWIGGPIESIQKWCKTYVLIQPGGLSRKEFSHHIAKKIDVNSDAIDKILPPGGVSITNEKGLETESHKDG